MSPSCLCPPSPTIMCLSDLYLSFKATLSLHPCCLFPRRQARQPSPARPPKLAHHGAAPPAPSPLGRPHYPPGVHHHPPGSAALPLPPRPAHHPHARPQQRLSLADAPRHVTRHVSSRQPAVLLVAGHRLARPLPAAPRPPAPPRPPRPTMPQVSTIPPSTLHVLLSP